MRAYFGDMTETHSARRGLLLERSRTSERRADAGRSKPVVGGTAASAATRELAIDDDGWNSLDAVRFAASGHVRISHIQDLNLAGFARYPVHEHDRLFTGWTASAEHFDSSHFVH
jgi:hypothetical protein